MKKHIVPDIVKNPQVFSLPSTATVKQAVDLMTLKTIGVVVVLENNQMAGIFSERDLVTRVASKGLDIRETPLKDVMTTGVKTVTPETTPQEALLQMRKNHFRHLPIIEKNNVIGMVSMRDLYDAVCQEMEEDLQEKEAFIFSGGY